MTTEEGGIRIGELLVRAGVITAADLSEAEKLSSHMKMQFGRLLIMAGCLTEEALECALEAQALIKQGLLSFDIAIEALGFAVEEKMSLKEALELLDVLPQFGTSTLKLAELIGEAAIIPDEKLIQSLELSVESNIPLGDVLVAELCIPATLLPLLSRFQEQIRTDTLNRPRALEELRGTFYVWQRADHSIASDPLSQSPIQKELPLTAKSGRDNSYRQVFPTPGGGTSYSPPRAPAEQDDGWIREDFSKSDKGKTSSEEVIIYSDGYFAEHERPRFDSNTFDDIPKYVPATEEISNDDEQRINDVLDIFAVETGTNITPLMQQQFDSQFDSQFGATASSPPPPAPPAQPASMPSVSGFVPASPSEPAHSAGANDALGLGGSLPADTIKALQALAFGAPSTKSPPSQSSGVKPAPPAVPVASSDNSSGGWRTVEPTGPDSWRSVEPQTPEIPEDEWGEAVADEEEYLPESASDEQEYPEPSSPQQEVEQDASEDDFYAEDSHKHGGHETGEPVSSNAHTPAEFQPFEIPSAPASTSQFDQRVSGEISVPMPSIRKIDKASSVFGQLDFGEPEAAPEPEQINNESPDHSRHRVAEPIAHADANDGESGTEGGEPPYTEVAEMADKHGEQPEWLAEMPEAQGEEAQGERAQSQDEHFEPAHAHSHSAESRSSEGAEPAESFVPEPAAEETENPEKAAKVAQSPESFFVHLGQALANHLSDMETPDFRGLAGADAAAIDTEAAREADDSARDPVAAEATAFEPAGHPEQEPHALDFTETAPTSETTSAALEPAPRVVPRRGRKKGVSEPAEAEHSGVSPVQPASTEPVVAAEPVTEPADETSAPAEPAVETSVSVEPADETSVSVEPADETSVSVEPAVETSHPVEPEPQAELAALDAESSVAPADAAAPVEPEPAADLAALGADSSAESGAEPAAPSEAVSELAAEPTSAVEPESVAEPDSEAVPTGGEQAEAVGSKVEPVSESTAESKVASIEEAPVVLDLPLKGKGKKKGKAAAIPAAIPAAVAEEPSDVVHLLQNAGFFKESELHESFLKALQDATLAPEILRVLGLVDKSVVDAAVRVHKLIKDGTIDAHRAVDSLQSIKAGKLKPADLTTEFGIKKPKRRK